MIKRASPFDMPNRTQEPVDPVPAAASEQNNRKRKFPLKVPQKPKWEIHKEPIKAYYFPINGDKYGYIGEYDGRTVIHFRVYRRGDTGTLIPTRVGACLSTMEFSHLREIAPEAQNKLSAQEDEEIGETLRQSLGAMSNWYFLCKQDPETSQTMYAIRLLLPTARVNRPELISTAKGISFDDQEFAKLIGMFEEMAVAVNEIESSFVVKDGDNVINNKIARY